jgi:hypothetical protein
MLIKFREKFPFQTFSSSEIHVLEIMDFYHHRNGEIVLYSSENIYYSTDPVQKSYFEDLENRLYRDGKIDLSNTNIVFEASMYHDRGDDRK